MTEQLALTLPGVCSWQRARGRGDRIAYPTSYERDRQAWAIVVRAAVQDCGWQPPPDARFWVVVKTLNGGKRDLDRVITAVCDALQAGGAIKDDCLVDAITAARRRERGAGARTEVGVQVLT